MFIKCFTPIFSLTEFPPQEPQPNVKEGGNLKLYTSPIAPWEDGILIKVRPVVKTLENKSFDIRQNIISKNKKVNKDIIIVTVDDPSYEYLIETYGDWPIPRNAYAEILDYIQSQKPKYVAFDLLFIK